MKSYRLGIYTENNLYYYITAQSSHSLPQTQSCDKSVKCTMTFCFWHNDPGPGFQSTVELHVGHLCLILLFILGCITRVLGQCYAIQASKVKIFRTRPCQNGLFLSKISSYHLLKMKLMEHNNSFITLIAQRFIFVWTNQL